MTRMHRKSATGTMMAVWLLALGCPAAFGQNGMTVSASAGNPMPNPAAAGETVTVSLMATVTNPPTGGGYGCPVSAPSWSWAVQAVQLNGAAAPAGSYSSSISQEPSTPMATLSVSFAQAGSWTVQASATVTFTDSPCSDVWTASGSVTTAPVAVVAIQASPNPVYVPVSVMVPLQITTTPSNYASSIQGVTVMGTALALALLVGYRCLGLTGVGRDPGPEDAASPSFAPTALDKERATDDGPDGEAAYCRLPVYYAMTPDEKQGRVGNFDETREVYYAWQGIVFDPLEKTPGYGAFSATTVILPLKSMDVREVDPPVYYLEVAKDLFAPGYYEPVIPTFYRWTGITLRESKIPEKAHPKRLLREGPRRQVIMVDPPAHLLRQPQRWRKD